MPVSQALTEAGVSIERAIDLIATYVEKAEARNTAGLMRREIYNGFARAHLTRDEEGYLILARGDRMLLAGNEAAPYHGTEYAVAEFVHRLGVRWYMPGDLPRLSMCRPSRVK